MLKCTVYDATGRELQPALATDAIIWEQEGNAVVLEYHDNVTYRTVKRAYQLPLTIVLKRPVKLGTKPNRTAPLTNLNLFVRDGFTCQYCGRKQGSLKDGEILNRDHVVPRDQGGPNTWENCVTACSTCNSKKANRTPEEARMKLRKPHLKAPKQADVQKAFKERRKA